MHKYGPILLALGCVVGCAGRGPDAGKVPVYPVAGTLAVDDRPVGNARIGFHPLDKSVSAACPVAVTRPDGTFRLMTYTADDGAPAGEYAVTVFWPNEAMPMDECLCPDPAQHDHLRGRYFDAAKSSLRATVRPEANTIALHATVGASGWNLPRLRDVDAKADRNSPGEVRR